MFAPLFEDVYAYSYDKIPLFSTIGHRPLPLMALRLSRLFGNSPEFCVRDWPPYG
jgi:hypothetical protein